MVQPGPARLAAAEEGFDAFAPLAADPGPRNASGRVLHQGVIDLAARHRAHQTFRIRHRAWRTGHDIRRQPVAGRGEPSRILDHLIDQPYLTRMLRVEHPPVRESARARRAPTAATT